MNVIKLPNEIIDIIFKFTNNSKFVLILLIYYHKIQLNIYIKIKLLIPKLKKEI